MLEKKQAHLKQLLCPVKKEYLSSDQKGFLRVFLIYLDKDPSASYVLWIFYSVA